MKKKTLILSGAAILGILTASFLFFRPQKPDQFARYDFVTVKRMDLSERIEATGQVIALEKKELYPDFEGTVQKINVKAGDDVKAGDLIMTLDSTLLNSQWQDANSLLKQAKINLNQAKTQLATEIALNRISKNNALQLEAYTNQVRLYSEQVKQAEHDLQSLKAKNNSVYTSKNNQLSIHAPFSAKISWVDVMEGDKISPQSRLATLIKPDRLGVDAQIDENDINLIRTGLPVQVAGKDTKQTVNSGRVSEISSQGHSTVVSGGTGAQPITDGVINFLVRIMLHGTPKGLLPGMSADVTILASSHPNAVTIPAGAVTRMGGNDMVRIRRGDKILPIKVNLGLKQGKYYEVKFGLKPGDRVAVAKPPSIANFSNGTVGGQRMGGPPFGR